IQQVIKDMHTPSWVRSVPHNFGDARAGTLKADDTASISQFFFRKHAEKMEGRDTLLFLFMMEERMTSYHSHIMSWLKSFPEVFPCASICPNYHMAIHIYDYLRLFGPVRSWWCFPYEHLIGHLQHMLTNHRFGQQEETVLQTFIQGSQIRCWLSCPECPKVIQQCKFLFD
ncbi:hypothetical protein PISMIDRAFT_36803, partial [Pisolithus microcarpus 441]